MSTAAIKPATQQSSKIRSPLVPHAAFWTGGLLIKLLFPATLKWVAYDSIATLLLSVWYPLCATIALIHREETQQHRNANTKIMESMQLERNFWIEYWSVGFAGVQCLHQFVSNIPSLQQMGRYEYPQLPILLMEIKLLFFLWIFAMDPILDRYQRFLGVHQKQERWKKFLPLAMLTQAIGPRLMRIQMAISERISRDTWQRLIHRKAQRVLELMVVLQFLGEDSMNYLLKLLEEGRSLLLLSVFMVLPPTIGQIGLLYAQFVFPSARSLAFRGQAMEILSLKYWVLNSMLTLFLSATWWIWWFMPFSRQIVLGIRCFATFPSTIVHHYANVEMELITFGILKGEPKLAVKETRTVQALRAVVKRLPRDRQASSFQFEIDESHSDSNSKNDEGDEESSVGSVDTTESEEERRRQLRRQKRAKKRLLKQQMLAESQGQPPALLMESIVAQYSKDDENDTQQTDGFVDIIDLTEYLSCGSDKEERDARNAPAADSTSRADIGYTTSTGSNHTASMRSNHISIGTPTETAVGEVEVQVRPKTGSSNRRYAPLFPVTHPKPSASFEGSLGRQSSMSLSGAPQTSNDDSDSFVSSNSMNEEQRTIISSGNVDYEIISAPRRSSRLEQLREWQQEQKRQKEEAEKLAKKKKSSRSKPRPEGSSETKSSDKKSKKADKSSPKKSKKSKTSPTKDGKKKAASPDKSTKRSKKKGEAPLEPEGEVSSSSKTGKPKKERVPNSLKKKKKKESGGLFN